MKKLSILFSIILVITLLTNCQNPKDNEKIDDEIFLKIVNKDLEVFKNYDSINYSSSEHYKRAIFICNSAENIVRFISEDKLNEDTINVYTQHLNEFSRIKDFSLYYDSFKS
jgi:PBP1b-binding outer membrane lipoprotein LpoB